MFAPKLAFALSMLFGAMQLVSASCPPGWLAWRDSCYYLIPQENDWFTTNRSCSSAGILAVPNSIEEHDFLWQKMFAWARKREPDIDDVHNFDIWIGCTHDPKLDGPLTCSGQNDGLDFSHWARESSKEDNICVRLAGKHDGLWAHRSCNSEFYFACEMNASLVPCLQPTRFKHAPHLGCMKRHIIKTLTVPLQGFTRCSLACWGEPLCKSFNFWLLSDDAKCELNFAYSWEAALDDFTKVDNCRFFE